MTNPMKAKALNNIGPDLAAFKNKVKYLPEVLTEGFEGRQLIHGKKRDVSKKHFMVSCSNLKLFSKIM